ncbi:hypothetical protein DFH09DRAFT_1289594 [Mycena vulgaris]|nr:hypothetical protein DFH09DRAFT_1289594 [Mycena vulgaris]
MFVRDRADNEGISPHDASYAVENAVENAMSDPMDDAGARRERHDQGGRRHDATRRARRAAMQDASHGDRRPLDEFERRGIHISARNHNRGQFPPCFLSHAVRPLRPTPGPTTPPPNPPRPVQLWLPGALLRRTLEHLISGICSTIPPFQFLRLPLSLIRPQLEPQLDLNLAQVEAQVGALIVKHLRTLFCLNFEVEANLMVRGREPKLGHQVGVKLGSSWMSSCGLMLNLTSNLTPTCAPTWPQVGVGVGAQVGLEILIMKHPIFMRAAKLSLPVVDATPSFRHFSMLAYAYDDHLSV